MKENALVTLKSYKDVDWISNESVLRFVAIAQKNVGSNEDSMLIAWTDLLSCWVNHFLKPSLTVREAERAGNELLPFFVLRAINFWFWAETVEVDNVEAAIIQQSKILRAKLSII